MADTRTRIKDLPLAEEITDNDYFVFDGSNSGTKKISKGTLFENIEANIESIESNITDIENEIGDTALPTTAQTITGAIAEHESDISALNSKTTNVIKNVEYTYGYTCAGNSSINITATQLDITPPTGYSPLAIRRIATGQNAIVVRNFNAVTSGNVVSLNNTSSSSLSGTVTVGFVYILSSLVSA